MFIKVTEFVVKNLPTKKTPVLGGFIGFILSNIQEEYQFHTKYLRKLKRR